MGDSAWTWDTNRRTYYRVDSTQGLYIYEDGSEIPYADPTATHTHEPLSYAQPVNPAYATYSSAHSAHSVASQSSDVNSNQRSYSIPTYPPLPSSGPARHSYHDATPHSYSGLSRHNQIPGQLPYSSASPTALPQHRRPKLIEDRYQDIQDLGSGGQTRYIPVKEVVDIKTNVHYALKTYVSDGNQYPTRKFYFDREVGIMKRLNDSPYVVKLCHHFWNDEEFKMYLLMGPVAQDGNLQTHLEKQFREPHIEHITDEFTHRALEDLARGLEDIHAHSVRHKDVKPGNILLYNGGLIYTDFGLSLDFTGHTGETNGQDPRNDCTRAYAAHETFDAKPRNPLSDVFCLGCIFFEIVTARCVAITQDLSWAEDTYVVDRLKVQWYGHPDNDRKCEWYSERVDNGRISHTLSKIEKNWDLRSVHNYLPWIRTMMDRIRDRRPEAKEILAPQALAYEIPTERPLKVHVPEETYAPGSITYPYPVYLRTGAT